MRIHTFQHVAFEGLGKIETWAQSAGHTLSTTRFFADEKTPDKDDYDFLIIMGGPMGANDDRRFSWMKSEKIAIHEAIRADKKILGICLGAQLLASVFGARVYPNREKEIGWWPIELNPPNVRTHPLNVLSQRQTVFHWHGDTFDLPKGGQHLARSRACENQAFSWGEQILGLQFHLETAAPQIEALLKNCADDLQEGLFIQDQQEILEGSANYGPPMQSTLFRFLDRFTS